MADTWDGGTGTVGIIKWEFNTDKTAIRYTRTDGQPWPPDIPQAMTGVVIADMKTAIEQYERMANEIQHIDQAFAATLRAQAQAYRGAAGVPPVATQRT